MVIRKLIFSGKKKEIFIKKIKIKSIFTCYLFAVANYVRLI